MQLGHHRGKIKIACWNRSHGWDPPHPQLGPPSLAGTSPWNWDLPWKWDPPRIGTPLELGPLPPKNWDSPGTGTPWNWDPPPPPELGPLAGTGTPPSWDWDPPAGTGTPPWLGLGPPSWDWDPPPVAEKLRLWRTNKYLLKLQYTYHFLITFLASFSLIVTVTNFTNLCTLTSEIYCKMSGIYNY